MWYLQLILGNKIKTRGVLRPIEPEVYVPGNYVRFPLVFALFFCPFERCLR